MNDESLTSRRNPSRDSDTLKPAWRLAGAAVRIDEKCLQKKSLQNSITPSFLKAGPGEAESAFTTVIQCGLPLNSAPDPVSPCELVVFSVLPALFILYPFLLCFVSQEPDACEQLLVVSFAFWLLVGSADGKF